MKNIAGLIVLTAGMAALASPAHAFGLSFDWGPTKKCFDSKSPPIKLTKVPNGTAKIRFRMVDLNAPNYQHGGGTVSFDGKTSLPYGAFRYTGPCPPSTHTYQISAEALDAKGKVLAKAQARKRFP